nr:PRD domain-containing protein [uncultured Mediterraneibacter sp.]
MIIEKIINNNIVSASDESGKELVVMGRGIGFGAKAGNEINEAKIEKIFRMESRTVAEQLKELLTNMPLERVKISGDIISYAKKILNLQLNQSIYVTLTDHINFAINRYKKGINLNNALLWEIKRFYSQEYELGRYAVNLIQERLGVELPEDEAGFIALHFVNAEYGTEISNAANFPNQVKKMLEIVTEDLGLEMDENSLHYERFVTHLKFLLQRVYRKELLQDEDIEMAEMIRRKYPKEFSCSKKVADYIEKEIGCKLSEEEKMYLAIHIRRVSITEEQEE